MKPNEDGTLSVTKALIDSSENESDEDFIARVMAWLNGNGDITEADTTFSNSITKTGSLSLNAVKTLKYADGAPVIITSSNEDAQLRADLMKLKFVLTKDGDSSVLSEGHIEFADNDDGSLRAKIVFDKAISYDNEDVGKEYTYTVKEVSGTDTSELGFSIDWKDGKKFKVRVNDPEESQVQDYFGKLVVETVSLAKNADGNDVFNMSGDANVGYEVGFDVVNTMNKKITITKKFLGLDALHTTGAATLSLYKMALFGGKTPVDEWVVNPDDLVESWNADAGEFSKEFVGLPKGTYRLYETVEDGDFDNSIIREKGYVELYIDGYGHVTAEDMPNADSEYVLKNRTADTVSFSVNLIKDYVGTVKGQRDADAYPYVTIKVTQGKQPADTEEGEEPKTFTETITFAAGETHKEKDRKSVV